MRDVMNRLCRLGALLVCAACATVADAPPRAPDGGDADTGAGAADAGSSPEAGSDAPPAADAGVDGRTDDDVPFARQRAACTFKQGALPRDTFGPSIANLHIPIDTIVIVSQENRSFDAYFSQLPAAGQPDVDVASAALKLEGGDGGVYAPFHETSYCVTDTLHDWDSMHASWNGGHNDGFVKVNAPDGERTLGYYDQDDLPFYYALATTYGVGDGYFSAVLGPTGPNRLFLYAGTSQGHVANTSYTFTGPSIFKRLGDAGVPFGVYSSSPYTDACPGPASYETGLFCADIPEGAKTFDDFVRDANAGTLPAVVWVDASSDEHPPADMQLGEVGVQQYFDALAASPQWAHAAFIVTYDEDGGQYDHVPPPSACAPDDVAPLVPDEAQTPGAFDRYGFRVPLLVASAYSKPHFVSHVVNSHTSILRFIELRFGLPACSNRDANESALLEFFDFSAPHFAVPSVPPPADVAPPTTKGCP